MRVALVITELDVGGAERSLVRLAGWLHGRPVREGDEIPSDDAAGVASAGEARADRWEVAVIALAGRPAPGHDTLVRQLEDRRIPVEFLGLAPTGRLGRVLAAGRAVLRLTDRLRRLRPDVCQTFLFHANVLGIWAAWRAGVPARVLGLRVADPRPGRLTLERWALGAADRAVCVSEGVRRHMVDLGRMPPGKLTVIPNGLPPAAFADEATLTAVPDGRRRDRRRAWGVPEDAFVVLGVGRLEEQKGFDELIAHLEEACAALPTLRLVLVGEGSRRAALAAQAETLGLAGRVHLVGRSADVPGDLAAADVFVLCSRYEGMANALLEAMAATRPVLVRPIEGVGELAPALGPVQRLQPFDGATLRDRLVRLEAEPDLRAELGGRNRAFVAATLTLDGMGERYATLYRDLLTNRSVRHEHDLTDMNCCDRNMASHRGSPVGGRS